MALNQKITPCLWFEGNALEAAEFYTSVFPNSEIREVHKAKSDTPGNTEGAVLIVTFTLSGQSYQALNGPPHDKFNDAISLSVSCEDQAEAAPGSGLMPPTITCRSRSPAGRQEQTGGCRSTLACRLTAAA